MSDEDLRKLERELRRAGRDVVVIDRANAETWYTVVGVDGRTGRPFFLPHFASSRRAAIAQLEVAREQPWDELRREGYRTAKVIVAQAPR